MSRLWKYFDILRNAFCKHFSAKISGESGKQIRSNREEQRESVSNVSLAVAQVFDSKRKCRVQTVEKN